ncbi:MAG TPA: helix-hairpin-helix domain-containing protein [Polyangiaceae bacterium]
MALLELETDAARHAGRGSKRVTSRAPRGGSRSEAPAAPGAFGRALERLRQNVWAPIALRVLGIGAGMLALAAIGAASIARGSGVPVLAGSSTAAASFLAGGLAPVAAAPERDAGASAADAGPAGPDAGEGSDAAPPDAGPPASPGLTPDGKVILNRASADEMRKLPGVGAKRAQAIVDLRTRLGGRFKRATDLLRVKGIGPKGLKKMEGHFVLDAPG